MEIGCIGDGDGDDDDDDDDGDVLINMMMLKSFVLCVCFLIYTPGIFLCPYLFV